MIFKHPHLVDEFKVIKPVMISAIGELDRWSVLCRLPQTTITCLMRNPDGNAEIYYKLYKKLLNGEAPTTAEQKQILAEIQGLSDEQLREKAVGRKSWHMVGRAVDLRSHHYTSKELSLVVKKLHRIAFTFGYGLDEYELLVHDVTAPHIHFALKPRKGDSDAT